jgi:hypothetical protein
MYETSGLLFLHEINISNFQNILHQEKERPDVQTGGIRIIFLKLLNQKQSSDRPILPRVAAPERTEELHPSFCIPLTLLPTPDTSHSLHQ